jgi:SAM-dependent methyltransferase
MAGHSEKYSRCRILDPAKLHKGCSRWNQCQDRISAIDKSLLHGSMLDLGCGVGHFVLEGLKRGINIWGVDPSEGKLLRFRRLVEFTGSPSAWRKRCIPADGEELPFASGRFTVVSSWYVLEHHSNPGTLLRELVRVTRPGGVLVIKAQDARRCWEGHCKIPWIPFLSGRMAKAWTEEFGVGIERCRDIHEVTQPQVAAILENLGCCVVAQAPEPCNAILNHWQIQSEVQVRRTARRILSRMEAGDWRPPPENPYLYTVKR